MAPGNAGQSRVVKPTLVGTRFRIIYKYISKNTALFFVFF